MKEKYLQKFINRARYIYTYTLCEIKQSVFSQKYERVRRRVEDYCYQRCVFVVVVVVERTEKESESESISRPLFFFFFERR